MLSESAQKIHQAKYALTRKSGKKETWEQTSVRVAEYVARAEDREDNYLQYTADFTKIISDRVFLPGGRILANAGTGIKNLFNCFVMPIEDSRQSIYKTLRDAAEIFAWGGGIGYNFSNLRETGAEVKTTGGKASGPVSFMELFDTTGEVISQASRRGAQMGILNVDHPDILKFIRHKNRLTDKNSRIFHEFERNYKEVIKRGSLGIPLQDETLYVLSKVLSDNQLVHFNVSVAITDDYMRAIIEGKNWILHGKDMDTLVSPADIILNQIASNAWKNGDPGIYFIDNANRDNIAPYLGRLMATNPCGEVPLLPYESCCLGSINLFEFVEKDFIDLDYLKAVVRYAVRFLDNIHSVNETPVEEVNLATKATRRLGLGVMGFADALAEMGIPYDHEDALSLAKIFGQTIQRTAWEYSMELAQEKGPFPEFVEDKINWNILDGLNLPHSPLRNIAITSIAPTGTIALIADVNSGIEPFFAKKYIRNITEGIGNVAKDTIDTEVQFDNIKTAHEIHWKDHILMQAEWQKYVDNAVSKTINMDESTTVEEIKDAFMMAWFSGCKGITVYRNNSKLFQILNS